MDKRFNGGIFGVSTGRSSSAASGVWDLIVSQVEKGNNSWPAMELYPFTTHTFTTASTNGRLGPTLATLQSAYAGQPWASNSAFFSQGRAQGYQVWTVPASGTYEIEVAGARGQSANSGLGLGLGAKVKGRVFLGLGTKLEMVVGQVPGASGSTYPGLSYAGAGGGSFVVYHNTSTPIMIAGGGGGVYYSLPMGNAGYCYGSTSERGHSYSNYSPANFSTMPTAGYGGSGYHGGGGGGLLGPGLAYSGYSGSGAMGTTGTAQLTTHGASFVGTTIDNVAGTWYATGGDATGAEAVGGFGGGGGGHSGNNSGGGGGGYSGGMGGQTSLGGSYLSGLGGGSYIISSATNVGTSDGKYNEVTTFQGASITNMNSHNEGNGYIKITKV